jgi:hypothetical protein
MVLKYKDTPKESTNKIWSHKNILMTTETWIFLSTWSGGTTMTGKKKGKGHFVLENMGRDGTGWDGIYMVSTGELGRLLSKKKKKKKGM